MGDRRNVLLLAACALAVSAAPAAAQLTSVGDSEAGEVIVDRASQYDREGDGSQSIEARVRLRSPIMEAGRIIDSMEVTLDWNCRTGEYREASRTYFTRAGEYVRNELPRAEWASAPRTGPLARTDALVCDAPPPILPVREYRPRRRAEAQVVELPGSAAR